MDRVMNRDYASLWPLDSLLRELNSHLGHAYHATVLLEHGDRDVCVLKAEGELRHWGEDGPSQARLPRDDDLTGTYGVGEAVLDLSDVPPQLEVCDMPAIGLIEVKLAEGVWLRLVPSQFAP